MLKLLMGVVFLSASYALAQVPQGASEKSAPPQNTGLHKKATQQGLVFISGAAGQGAIAAQALAQCPAQPWQCAIGAISAAQAVAHLMSAKQSKRTANALAHNVPGLLSGTPYTPNQAEILDKHLKDIGLCSAGSASSDCLGTGAGSAQSALGKKLTKLQNYAKSHGFAADQKGLSTPKGVVPIEGADFVGALMGAGLAKKGQKPLLEQTVKEQKLLAQKHKTRLRQSLSQLQRAPGLAAAGVGVKAAQGGAGFGFATPNAAPLDAASNTDREPASAPKPLNIFDLVHLRYQKLSKSP